MRDNTHQTRKRRQSSSSSRQFIKRLSSWLVVTTVLMVGTAHAASLYWDTDTSTLGNAVDGTALGGTGVWDTTIANWWDLASLTTWPNTNLDEAIFTGPLPPGVPVLNTVTISSAVTANRLTFRRSGYTISGGNITLGGTTPTIAVNLGESVTIDSLIQGSAGLTKTGGGSIRLTNASNSYTGTTTIANGSLIISSAAALGGTGAVSILSTNETPSNSALFGFGGGSLVLDGASTGFTFSRDLNIEGRGPIGDRGAAVLSLGNNTLSGTVTSAVSPLTPATFRSSRITSVNGTLTLSGTLTSQGTSASTFVSLGGVNTAGTGNFTFGGVGTLTGTGSIEKSGGGTLFLNSLASNAGFTGTVRVGGSATGTQSSVRVTDLMVGANSTFGGNVGTNASSAIDMNGGVLEFRNEGNLDFNSLSSGKNVYLRGNSTFYTGPGVGGDGVNGTTTLGTFRVAANTTATFASRNGYGFTLGAWTQESSNNNTTITNNLGGTLTFTGNAWNNNDGSNRTLTISGNGNTIITGDINTSGAGTKTLTKTGSGNLTLIGTGTTLNGPVNVQGALTITDFRSINNNTADITLGSATTTAGHLVIGTSTAATAGGLTTSRPIILNGTTAGNSIYANQTGSNPVELNGAITKPVAGDATLNLGGSNTADNIINTGIPALGTGGVLKVGSGTWVLAAPNSYTGATTIVNGTLKLKANAAVSTILAAANDITFGNSNVFAGGTLEFVGQDGVNNVQALDVLTTSLGASTVRLTPGSGGTASLTFASQVTGAAGTVNFVGADFVNNKITITGANGLISRTNYWEGADFAFRESNVLRAPVYGTDAGFVTSSSALTAAANMEITGSFATNTVSISTLKIAGSHTLTLNAAQTVTLSAGGLLATGGDAVITGGTALDLGTQALVVRTDLLSDSVDIQSIITGSGGLTKGGAGTLILSGVNTQTGTVNINEGTVQLSGSGRLGAAAALTMRQGTVLDLNGVTPSTNTNAFNNNGSVTSATAATFTVGGSNGTGTSFGTVNGAISLTKLGTGNQSWFGNSTYTGVTTIGSTGLVTVDTLANGGVASGIGASTNAASNLVFNGSTGGLVYAGVIRDNNLTLGSRSATTDRLFTLSGTGATLSSTVSNNNAIVWSNTGAIVHGVTGPQLLTFAGTSLGDNTFNPRLTDSGTGANITSVTKTSTGQWNLGNSNNTYTGVTTVSNGILALNHNGALPANSPVALGTTTTNGILQLSGTFARDLAATATAGTGTVTWAGTTGGGGFAAHTTQLTVTLNGGAGLTWGSGGFVGTGGTQALIFNSASALADVLFTNAIDFGASTRTITVNDNVNTGTDYATLSGILSGAGGGLLKNGTGILRLTSANTYTGTTEVQAGTLVVQSLGNSADALNTPTSVGLSGVAFGDSNAIVLGNATTTGGILQYVGAGETSDRKIRLNGTTASNQIHADGSGPLILTNVAHDTTATGDKTLFLRGSNTAGNLITSALTNNGAGVLSVTVDGSATWILTNPGNIYTGSTTAGAGALGIGDNAALGTGTLIVSNANVFAYGADRTIANTLQFNNNTSHGFIGDYSLTFTNALTFAASSGSSNFTNNSIVSGEALTFAGGVVANSLGGNRNWQFDGSGETIINGNFTTSTAFGVNVIKTGNGILTLGTNGATSNWNQAGNNVDVDRGTLKFSANNAIPTASAANGGLTLSPEVATTDTATVDLNGTTQTVNALTATSNGTLVLDNKAATSATFRFGANNTNVDFGGTSLGTVAGTGSYTITDTGAGALSIVKLGNTSTTFGSHVVLTHQGTTAVEGGTLNLDANLNGTTGLIATNSGSALNLTGGATLGASATVSASGGAAINASAAPVSFGTNATISATGSGSTLTFTGGIGNAANVVSLALENGTTLNLLDSAGSKFTNLTNLQLGSTGGTLTTLNLNVGDTSLGDDLKSDTFTLLTGGTLSLFAGNQITFNLTDAGLNASQTYELLNVVDGGLTTGVLAATDYLLGATPGGFSSITLTANDTSVFITTGTLITGSLFWRGLAGGGTDDTWNANVNNWSQDKANTSVATSIPGQGTDVVFAINSASGAVATTLEQNFKINSLTFEAGTTTPTSVTIAPGAISTNRLEIAPQAATAGIAISTGGPAAATISAPLNIGANQTWTVADAASVLTLSGGLQGEADVTKAGAGKVVLSAAADSTFNIGLTSDLTVTAGNLEITNVGALGSTASSNAANLTLTGGGFYYNGTTGTVNNNLTLNGGTLSAGTANQTYNGTVNISGNSSINLRDSNSSVTTTTQRDITLSGALSGAGNLTLDSIDTATTGNQITGNLVVTNSGNSGWSGDLNILRGTVIARTGNADALGSGDINFEFGKVEWEGAGGATYNLAKNITIARSGGNAVAEWNIDRTSGSGAFTVNNSGTVTLGGVGGTGELRILLADTDGTAANFTGPVVLANDAAIHVRDNATLALATVSGIISESGGSRSLIVNGPAGGGTDWGGTDGILRLTGLNTFTGNVTLGGGTLEFNTVTNISGGASALGNGTALTSTANGVLRFVGTTAQSTDRPINASAGILTLSANGDEAVDTITYNGAISTNANNFSLTGATGREGIIAGGITQTGDAADATVNGGTWTHATGTSRVGDDLTVTGTGTILNLNSGLLQVRDDLTVTANGVLNLNATGALSYNTATLSADASLLITNGGVVNLGANDAIDAAGFDRLFIGQSGGGALPGTLNMGAFNLTASRLILGERLADREGVINGTGTLTVTGGDIDLIEGTINANLASTGTGTFEKFGPDTVTLAGDNSGLASTGDTIINEGTLVFDYTTSNNTKVKANEPLDMRGSNLILNGNASAATAQNVLSFTLGSGGNSVITLNPGAGQDLVLNLNAITRAVNAQDGTIRFNLPTGTQSATNGITTDSLNTIGTGVNAILGGWATVNDGTGTFFARNLTNAANGNLGIATTTVQDDVASWVTGENISDSSGFTGTLGRDFTLNSLRFNAAAGSDLLLGAAGHLRLTSGGILVTGNVGGTPSITGGTLDAMAFALPIAINDLIITQDSAASFEISSSIHLNNNLVKSGSGTLLLSGTNGSSGFTEIQNGTLQLSGGSAIGDGSLVTLATNRNSTLQLLGNETIGRLAGGRRNDNSDYGTVSVGSHSLTINQTGGNTTYAGKFTGSGTVTKTGNGTLTLSGNDSTGLFTGDFRVNQGLVVLNSTGTPLQGVNNITLSGSTSSLRLDNDQTTAVGSRIRDAATITLNSTAGTTADALGLYVSRTAGTTAGTETVGQLILNSGHNTVAADGTATDRIGRLLFSNAAPLVRNNFSTLFVVARNFSATVGQRGRISFSVDPGGAIGGGGAAASSSISIYPFIVGEDTTGAPSGAVNFGNTFVRYESGTQDLRPLDLTSEYVVDEALFNALGAGILTNNIRFTTTPGAALDSDTTGINSLILDSGAGIALTGPAQGLEITSGAILSAGVGSNTIGGFTTLTTGAGNPYYIYVTNPAGTLTLASTTLSSPEALVKSGAGTLVLGGANGVTGAYLNQGTLEISDLDNIGGNSGVLAFAGGTLRLGAGFTDDISSRTITFLPGGATLDANGNSLVLANAIGGGGEGGFTKTGTGDLTLNAAASYSGATAFTDGTLTLGVTNALPSGTALALGSGSTNATLDTNGFDPNLGSLTVSTNSTTLTTQVTIDPGNTLSVNGPVLIGADAAAATTLFTATGGGNFVQNQDGGTFRIGGGTGTINTNAVTADFSGLANFTTDLGMTGVFRVGDSNANSSGTPTTNSTLTLAGTSNTITAGLLGIGDSMGQAGTATLELGGGSNVINADTIYIGAISSARGSGAILFDGATGTLTLRGSAGGTSRANVAMTTARVISGFDQTNTFLTAGHSADLRIDTFLMSERTDGAGDVTSTFTFDTGTLDITSLVMSRRSGVGTGDSASTVTLGGGTATIGSIDMAASTGTGVGSDAVATLNVTGGTVNIGTGSGTAINLANAGAGRTVTSNVNLTGGTVTVTGNIIRTGGAGTESATVTLAGGSLDMSNFSVGTAGAPVSVVAESGTLTALFELNDGGAFTKTTGGELVVAGTNAYTGATIVDEGTMLVSGSLSGTASVAVQDGGTLAGTGIVNPLATVTVATGGTLSPGNSPGVLSVGSVALDAGSSFRLELGGTTPGNLVTNHDQLVVAGTVTLAGNASVSLFGTYADPGVAQVNDTFLVILNNGGSPVAGAFANAPGGILFGTDGSQFTVNYAGGDGNDVVLTLAVVPEPGSLVTLLGGVGMLVGLQRFRRRKS